MNRLNYGSVIKCKNIADFFQKNHEFLINANKFLEKLSNALKKALSRDTLTNEEKRLVLQPEKKHESPKNRALNGKNESPLDEKGEEIRKLRLLLEGSIEVIKNSDGLLEKDQTIKVLKEELSSFKMKFDNVKFGIKFFLSV